MELDLCGDTCAACSELAFVSSSDTSGQASATDQDQVPAVVLLQDRPATDRSPIGLARAADGSPPSPTLPAHLASTVLRR